MDLYDTLKDLNINYLEVSHKPIYTIEDAININLDIDGVECKNLFLKGKNKYYLVMIEASSKIDLKKLQAFLFEGKLSFASTLELKEILNLDLGSVSPLAIINDKFAKVKILIDNYFINKRILMHPNINSKTVSIYYDDLVKFIKYFNHEYVNFSSDLKQ